MITTGCVGQGAVPGASLSECNGTIFLAAGVGHVVPLGPLVLKPTAPGADRTYYLKVLGNSFILYYGKPLPLVVQELASLYFPDIVNVDESGVRRRIRRSAKSHL